MMSAKQYIKVIDIFAGPGGLGEGFAAFEDNGKNPFDLSLSIEKDAAAHSTLLMRSFYRQFGAENIPKDYWDYLKGNIAKHTLFDKYPRQIAMAHDEARCLELGNPNTSNLVMHVHGYHATAEYGSIDLLPKVEPRGSRVLRVA